MSTIVVSPKDQREAYTRVVKSKTAPYRAVLLHSSCDLCHLHVDCDAAREIEVRESLNNFGIWRHNVDKALVNTHLELLTCVLVDER
mgnify:CR=1 FL=1